MIKITERGDGSKRVQVKCSNKKSRVRREMKDECDVNVIMNRFMKTGKLPELMKENPGMYGDFSEVKDYQESMQIVLKAQEQFNALPSKIRNEFNNDPEEFLAFVNNAENLDKMIEMGIAVKVKSPGSEETSGVTPGNGASAPVNTEAGKKKEDIKEGSGEASK